MNQLMNIVLSFTLVVFAIIPVCWIMDTADVVDTDDTQEEFVDESFSFNFE